MKYFSNNQLKKVFFICVDLILIGVIFGQACDLTHKTNGNVNSESLSDGCTPGPGATGKPQTIKEAVDLVNSLPKPMDAACFIQSLERPLQVSLTSSTSSAQPAYDSHNPRVFIFSGKLIISIVTAGPGSQVLELGEQLENFRSVKGEIPLPITGSITLEVPFAHLLSNRSTSCGFCHANENLVPSGEYSSFKAYVSTALQPRISTLVPIDKLQYELNACDPKIDPDRCKLLRAIFSYGQVVSTSFPTLMPGGF